MSEFDISSPEEFDNLNEEEKKRFKEEHFQASGFPSPAQEYAKDDVSADDIINRGYNTFFCRMQRTVPEWRFQKGDFIVVSKGTDIRIHEFFIGWYNNEFRVLRMGKNGFWTSPHTFSKSQVQVWGKVTHAIVSYQQKHL
ncbi:MULTISPECIES: LexA family protein [Flammeovirga]|uniref:Peptidase S24/S26A/S26B/S26C domain-containing protein n=1 Tax=Flammeovirga agarivorans TaxID=2726742 RepID=A0A7X8XVZ4_9BACT|nr:MULTISPECIES: hypothetical protein [Flammeovirga]NLR91580.1 hypothetical protein [Flammeovirga agarivorans]